MDVSELARDQSTVIETQQNRIRYLEREVAELEQKLARLSSGPSRDESPYEQRSFEAAMEDRFPTEAQAAELARGAEVSPERAPAWAEPAAAPEPHRTGPVAETPLSK